MYFVKLTYDIKTFTDKDHHFDDVNSFILGVPIFLELGKLALSFL